MSTFSLLELEDVLAMLRDCAPGVTIKEHLHHYCVEWGDRFFPSLPLGDRTSRRKMVYVAKVRNMVRALQIPKDCANRHFPGLLNWLPPPTRRAQGAPAVRHSKPARRSTQFAAESP